MFDPLLRIENADVILIDSIQLMLALFFLNVQLQYDSMPYYRERPRNGLIICLLFLL